MRRTPRPSLPKYGFQGEIISAQSRIRLLRSYDQRNHSYLGYSLTISGVMDGESGEFTVGIGKAAQQKHEFRCGDVVSGVCEQVRFPRESSVGIFA